MDRHVKSLSASTRTPGRRDASRGRPAVSPSWPTPPHRPSTGRRDALGLPPASLVLGRDTHGHEGRHFGAERALPPSSRATLAYRRAPPRRRRGSAREARDAQVGTRGTRAVRGGTLRTSRASMGEVRRRGTSCIAPQVSCRGTRAARRGTLFTSRASMGEVRRRGTSCIASRAARRGTLFTSRASMGEVRRRETSSPGAQVVRRGTLFTSCASMGEVRRRGASCIVP